jgi:hypothetical protein
MDPFIKTVIDEAYNPTHKKKKLKVEEGKDGQSKVGDAKPKEAENKPPVPEKAPEVKVEPPKPVALAEDSVISSAPVYKDADGIKLKNARPNFIPASVRHKLKQKEEQDLLENKNQPNPNFGAPDVGHRPVFEDSQNFFDDEDPTDAAEEEPINIDLSKIQKEEIKQYNEYSEDDFRKNKPQLQ